MATGPNFLSTKNRANFLSTRNSGMSRLLRFLDDGDCLPIWNSPAPRPGGLSHIRDSPDSRPVRRRGGMLSEHNSSALRRGGLSHIWDSPRLPGQGDRPIYGTIWIPDLSGAEEERFPSTTPRAFRRGRNNSQRAGSKPGNPPACPRFHDIPARYRVGLSGRSRAWRRSGGSLREERRVIPGMKGPNFVATKKCALFYGATKFGLRGVFHIQNAGSLSRSGVFHGRNARPWASGSRRLRHYPPPPMCSRGLSHGVSLRVLRGFPAGSPQAHAGFSPGILPPKADKAGPWDSPGQNLSVPRGLPPGAPTARPSRGFASARPGPLKAFSQGPSREAHGKGMGGWG
jgi:hypothetical protein